MLHSRDYLLIQLWLCHPLLDQQRNFTPLPQLEYANDCCLEYSSTTASKWSQSHLGKGPGLWYSRCKLEAQKHQLWPSSQCPPPKNWNCFFRSLKNFLLITVHTYSQPQSRTTLPNRIQSTLSQNIAWLEEWAYTDGSCQIHQGEQVTNAGTYHPALLNGLGITKKQYQQSWTGCYHSRHLPLTASRLSTKSGKTCCTLSLTAATYKGIFWRYDHADY